MAATLCGILGRARDARSAARSCQNALLVVPVSVGVPVRNHGLLVSPGRGLWRPRRGRRQRRARLEPDADSTLSVCAARSVQERGGCCRSRRHARAECHRSSQQSLGGVRLHRLATGHSEQEIRSPPHLRTPTPHGALNPTNADYQTGFCEALGRAGDVQTAAEKCLNALVAVPNPSAYLYAMAGSWACQIHEPRSAADAYAKAIELEPDNAAYQAGLCEALGEAGDIGAAAESCQAAVTVVSIPSAYLFAVTGYWSLQAGDPESAAAAYADATELDPTNADYHVFRARALTRRGPA